MGQERGAVQAAGEEIGAAAALGESGVAECMGSPVCRCGTHVADAPFALSRPVSAEPASFAPGALDPIARCELRRALAERGGGVRRRWPSLLPQRVELLGVTAAAERTAEGDPAYVDHLFEVLLNDPEGTRLHIPVRVTAQAAATPGHFDEAPEEAASPDFHHSAWQALGRFAAALARLGSFAGRRRFDTPYARWSEEADEIG